MYLKDKGRNRMSKWSQRLGVPAAITRKRLHVLGCFASMILLLVVLTRNLHEDTTASYAFQSKSYKVTALSSGKGGTAASDSFQRTIANGWGGADKGGWWTIVGSPWSWSVSPAVGSVNVGAGGEERSYLSSFNIQDVDIVEKVVLPRCTGKANCDAFVLGRYSSAYNPTYYRVGLVQGTGRADLFLRAQRSQWCGGLATRQVPRSEAYRRTCPRMAEWHDRAIYLAPQYHR
jgi:hypothetical protein